MPANLQDLHHTAASHQSCRLTRLINYPSDAPGKGSQTSIKGYQSEGMLAWSNSFMWTTVRDVNLSLL